MKINRRRSLRLVVLLLALQGILVAQDPPIEWGEIPLEDLSMTSFPADSNATAVILCDYGESSFSDDMKIIFRRHARIKILTTAGFGWGTHSVIISSDNSRDRIDDIEAVTYNLAPDGSVESREMDSESVFEEDLDGSRRQVKFTLPSLAPGCIIEFRYKISTEYFWQIQDWTFQREEPVRWSEYRVRMPRAISYLAVTQGYIPFHVEENVELKCMYSGEAAAYLDGRNASCYQFRWVIKDAPALREEPFMTSLSDYAVRVDVQLAGYSQMGIFKKVLQDWNAVAEELRDNPWVGEMIDPSGEAERAAASAVAGITDPVERMKAIYGYVQKTFLWSERTTIYARQTPEELVESKKGNGAELMYFMISMLRSAGIETFPVMLSTRSNGKLQQGYPIVAQFNHVIALCRIGTADHYLDPTDPNRPYDILPKKVLNVEGMVVTDGPVAWVKIASPKRAVHRSLCNVRLSADGSFAGTVESLDDEYGGLAMRGAMGEKKEMEVANEAFSADASGITLDSVSITNRDSVHLPLKIRATLRSEDSFPGSADMLYVNPLIVDRIGENPFKLPERLFPVDMPHGIRTTTVVNIEIPEGYAVKDRPPDQIIGFAGNPKGYTRRIGVQGNIIQVFSEMELTKTQYTPSQYPALRSFYDQVVAAQNELLVLHRTSGAGK